MTVSSHTDVITSPVPAARAVDVRGSRDQLRVAIVGAGKMGRHHAAAINRLGASAHVTAVADPTASARDAMLRLCPSATAFPDVDELLETRQVDVVHVCTAPQTHEALATQALEAGCHVYVEKPFAESWTAAARLTTLAESKGLKLCAGHQLLYEPPARRAWEALPALGNVVHAESYFSFRTVRRSPDGRVPLRADLQLLDILPHPVYLLLRCLEAAAPTARAELTSLEIGAAGTIHALVRRGHLTGMLIVTLEGRPVESYLRIVGTNGTVHADFVRSTVQRLIGPGTSGIDKALNPFRLSWQLLSGTVASLGGRAIRRQRSYPGLAELFEAFYHAIRTDSPSPVSPESVLETTAIWEQVAKALDRPAMPRQATRSVQTASSRHPRVAITGGTGFLGKEIVRALTSQGASVRVVSRRTPAAWERIPEADYLVADLGQPLSENVLRDIDVVIHAAAETAGGWEEHRRNSIAATEHILRAAADAGVRRVIHVSSLAVLAAAGGKAPATEGSPLEPKSEERGPYVWGKLESERLAARLGRELGLEVKIVRPGALVDYRSFEPPGRLGKRLGNIFVAVGAPGERLGVADVGFAGKTIAWMACRFVDAPEMLNLLAPVLPTKQELVSRLRRSNPDLTVLWLPMFVLVPLSWTATALQKLLRPRKAAVNVAKVFAGQRYDTSRIAGIAPAVEELFPERVALRG